MLTSYIGPKGIKDFCDILNWQIIRKLIPINSFFKEASLIKVIGLQFYKILFPVKVLFKPSIRNSSDNFRNISNRFFREPLSFRLYISLQTDEICTLSIMFLRTANANSRNHSVEQIFLLHKAFLMNASQLQFIGLKTLQIAFRR